MSSFKLKAIQLDNLSQVTVAPSASNVDRSYGRRFTVTMGDDSKEVVLKDLFKKAQKLAKTASSASELNDVYKFIAKLQTAETAAAIIYKDRDDCIYKFRSWFHRFFGGAFFGSHLDRLGNLKNKVDSKQERLVDDFKTFFKGNLPVFQSFVNKGFEVKVDDQIYHVKGEGALPHGLTLKIQNKEDLGTNNGLLEISLDNHNECNLEYEGRADGFPPELAILLGEITNEAEARLIKAQEVLSSLTLIKAVVSSAYSSINFDFEGKKYVISKNSIFNIWSTPKIYIQEERHQGSDHGLFISLDNTEQGFDYEGEKVPSIPDSAMPLFNAVVLEAYKRSTTFSYGIRVIRAGIKQIPEWHLNELSKYLKNGGNLSVKFLRDDLNDEEGTDVGGVKRDYISILASSLQESKALFAPVEGTLKLPRILRENQGPILYCNEEEVKTYSNLGFLFSRCYESRSSTGYERDLITTGCFFSEALFKAALSLQESEFTLHGHPKKETYVKIAKVLLKTLDTEGTPTIKDVIKCLDITQDSLESILDPNDETLYKAVLLAGEAKYTDDDGMPDIEKIKSDPKKFIDDLHASIFTDTSLSKNLKGVSLGAMLDPVYQVSCGLKESLSTSWNDFRNKDPVEVSDKIQGSIDREKIVANITCDSYHSNVRLKTGWLKEWISDEATDEELKSFLRFVTGGASLPAGKQLKVSDQGIGNPFPTVCTCGLGISVSNLISYPNWKKDKWDGKKEDFIRNLKHAMVVEGFQNS